MLGSRGQCLSLCPWLLVIARVVGEQSGAIPNTIIKNGVPVQEHPNVAMGVPPFIKPSESDWKNPHNHQPSAKACEMQCHKLAACKFGTYVTKDADRKGECWLSAKGGKGVPCVKPMRCLGFQVMHLKAAREVKRVVGCQQLKVAGIPASSPASKCNGEFELVVNSDRVLLQHRFHKLIPGEAGYIDPHRPIYQQKCVTKDDSYDKAYTSHLIQIHTSEQAHQREGDHLWQGIEDKAVEESCDNEAEWRKPIREMTQTEAAAARNVRRRILYFHKEWSKWVVSDMDPRSPLHMISKLTKAQFPYSDIKDDMLQWYINSEKGGHYLSRDELKVSWKLELGVHAECCAKSSCGILASEELTAANSAAAMLKAWRKASSFGMDLTPGDHTMHKIIDTTLANPCQCTGLTVHDSGGMCGMWTNPSTIVFHAYSAPHAVVPWCYVYPGCVLAKAVRPPSDYDDHHEWSSVQNKKVLRAISGAMPEATRTLLFAAPCCLYAGACKSYPTVQPTLVPTGSPIAPPSQAPTISPSSAPTVTPTGKPTSPPSHAPTLHPTRDLVWEGIYGLATKTTPRDHGWCKFLRITGVSLNSPGFHAMGIYQLAAHSTCSFCQVHYQQQKHTWSAQEMGSDPSDDYSLYFDAKTQDWVCRPDHAAFSKALPFFSVQARTDKEKKPLASNLAHVRLQGTWFLHEGTKRPRALAGIKVACASGGTTIRRQVDVAALTESPTPAPPPPLCKYVQVKGVKAPQAGFEAMGLYSLTTSTVGGHWQPGADTQILYTRVKGQKYSSVQFVLYYDAHHEQWEIPGSVIFTAPSINPPAGPYAHLTWRTKLPGGKAEPTSSLSVTCIAYKNPEKEQGASWASTMTKDDGKEKPSANVVSTSFVPPALKKALWATPAPTPKPNLLCPYILVSGLNTPALGFGAMGVFSLTEDSLAMPNLPHSLAQARKEGMSVQIIYRMVNKPTIMLYYDTSHLQWTIEVDHIMLTAVARSPSSGPYNQLKETRQTETARKSALRVLHWRIHQTPIGPATDGVVPGIQKPVLVPSLQVQCICDLLCWNLYNENSKLGNVIAAHCMRMQYPCLKTAEAAQREKNAKARAEAEAEPDVSASAVAQDQGIQGQPTQSVEQASDKKKEQVADIAAKLFSPSVADQEWGSSQSAKIQHALALLKGDS